MVMLASGIPLVTVCSLFRIAGLRFADCGAQSSLAVVTAPLATTDSVCWQCATSSARSVLLGYCWAALSIAVLHEIKLVTVMASASEAALSGTGTTVDPLPDVGAASTCDSTVTLTVGHFEARP
jgi:hypothetical protein